MAKTKARNRSFTISSKLPPVDRRAWLTQVAFVLALGLVVARATMLEILREPFAALPGGEAIPRGPGPASSLILDLFCCVPALLVLARRALDRTYVIRLAWSHLAMGLLGIWTVLSTLWAADRFAAAVNGSHFFSAITLLWAASQLMRSWLRLRLVAALGLGLLLVYLAHGYIYRLIELPDMIQSLEQNPDSVLMGRPGDSDDFQARQFRNKILNMEILGFGASSNTFAAVIVLLGIVVAGILLQRRRDADSPGWLAVPAITLLAAAPILWMTRSNTAYATPFLAAIFLAAIWKWGRWLGAHARGAYIAGVALVFACTIAVIAHGIAYNTLFHISLTFRWRYWIGALGIFLSHPILGVGWNNFDAYYLVHRLSIAVEEIKDPHNFIVRVFVELGLIGGLMLLAWMLRLGWELTRPVLPAAAKPPPDKPAPGARPDEASTALRTISTIAAAAILINIIFSIDWTQNAAFVGLELLKRLLFFGLLLIGLATGSLWSAQRPRADDRAAPWILHAILVGLGIFLLHNLVDFSLFEIGPMFIFAMFAGSALGVRMPPAAGQARRTKSAIAALAAGVAIWTAAGIFFVLPVIQAEQLAHAADQNIRLRRFDAAASQLSQAHSLVPTNADYAFRAAAIMLRQSKLQDARGWLDIAISANSMRAEYYLTRAELALNFRDLDKALDDLNRATELNPFNIPTRLAHAQALVDLGMKPQAIEQYEKALEFNEKLKAIAEPRQLSEEKKEAIRQSLEKLRKEISS